MTATFRQAVILHEMNRDRRGSPIVVRHLQDCVECDTAFPLADTSCPGCGSSSDVAIPRRRNVGLMERLAESRWRDYQALQQIRESTGRLRLAS